MPAPPVQPIVIWFGRVGDLILLSALLEILHRRFGSPCHVIGAGAWPAELYAAHADVARVSCLHRYTAWAFDPTWWRTRRSLRASRAGPVYVCETDPRKLARIRRLLRFSGIEAARCAPLLTVSEAARAECAAWLERQGWRDRTLILVQPGNRRTMRGRRLRVSPADDKAWPLERWAGLLRRIHARLPQALIVLCGAPRESRLLEWIAAAAQLPAGAAGGRRVSRPPARCARARTLISLGTRAA